MLLTIRPVYYMCLFLELTGRLIYTNPSLLGSPRARKKVNDKLITVETQFKYIILVVRGASNEIVYVYV